MTVCWCRRHHHYYDCHTAIDTCDPGSLPNLAWAEVLVEPIASANAEAATMPVEESNDEPTTPMATKVLRKESAQAKDLHDNKVINTDQKKRDGAEGIRKACVGRRH